MIHNNPGNYPDPMPSIGEPCPAPEAMPTRKSAAAMAAEILGLRARVAELENDYQVMTGARDELLEIVNLEADWGLEAKDSRIAELEAAMSQAVVWMAADGCDCGASENGSCALCMCNALLNKR